MMQETTSNFQLHGMPREVIDGDFETAVKDLLGFEVKSVQTICNAMKATLLSEGEVLAWIYLKGIQALQRSLNHIRQHCKDDAPVPHIIFKLADNLVVATQAEMVKQCEMYLASFMSQIPPTFSNTTYQAIGLREGGQYRLSSDSRNDGQVELLIADMPRTLQPGESVELTGGVALSVASQRPQLLKWERLNGLVRVGDMSGVLPLPKRVLEPVVDVVGQSVEEVVEPVVEQVVEQEVEPIAIVAPVKKSFWSFRKSK
jgi:hypothetical protein